MNSKGPDWKHKKRRQKRKHKRELRQEEMHQKTRKPKRGQEERRRTDHQPEEGTWSPATPDEPLKEPGERRRIARGFSL